MPSVVKGHKAELTCDFGVNMQDEGQRKKIYIERQTSSGEPGLTRLDFSNITRYLTVGLSSVSQEDEGDYMCQVSGPDWPVPKTCNFALKNICDFSNGVADCAWSNRYGWTFGGSTARVGYDKKKAVLETKRWCTLAEGEHCVHLKYELSPVRNSQQRTELHVMQVDTRRSRQHLWMVKSSEATGWRSVYIPIRKGNKFKIWIRGWRSTVPMSSVIAIDDLQYLHRPCPSTTTTTTYTPTSATTTPTTTGSVSTTASSDEDEDGSDNLLYLVIGLIVAAVVTIANGVMLCYCRKRRNTQKRRRNNTNDNEGRTDGSRGPPALPTAGPPDTDHYNTVYELSMSTTITTTPTTTTTTTTDRTPTPNTATSSPTAVPPPFCGRRSRPCPSALSGAEDEAHYIDIDKVGISTTTTTTTTTNSVHSTSTAAPTFSKSRSVVVQRVKAQPVPASTRLLADSQTFSLLKQRCEPITGEEDYNTLSLHHGQTPQETATKTGRELLYNHLDSVANSEVRAGHKSETTEQENYNSLSFHQGPNLKQTATTTTGRPAVYNHLDSVADSEVHIRTLPGPETTNQDPVLFRVLLRTSNQ
ncbi:uncharacterized protein LOC143286646 [Babylonia areolata]|uniref:uncharacterized protein LOC143286646 n=1 Tax=Babylonia areolata TaxID=304850 RepID=UPI003FD553ED